MNKKILSTFRFCHLWIGLIGGWFLFVLFISGTICIFDKETMQWMQPELGYYQPSQVVSQKALNQAYDLWEERKDTRKNFIALPNSRDSFLRVLYSQDKIVREIVIDPQKGTIIPTRKTGGIHFFFSLHSNLFLGRQVGGAIVLLIATAFITVIISGIIIYLPNVIKNAFFVLPKPKSLRFKSDLHTMFGIFALPFLSIIAMSGFLFLAPRYLPNVQTPKSISHVASTVRTDSGHGRPDLYIMLNKAILYFRTMPSAITFSNNEVRFMESDHTHVAHNKNYIAFNRDTGKISFPSAKPSFLAQINQTLKGIHLAKGGDIILRIVFALMGACSAVLVACGLVFYSTKKRNSKIAPTSTGHHLFYKVVEGINVGIIMGTLIAAISYFWFNRIISPTLSNRIGWEVTGFFSSFFLVFIFSVAASIIDQTKHAWTILIGSFSALCMLLPIIDYAMTSNSFKAAIVHYNYLYLIIDLTIFMIGLFFFRLCFYVQKKGTR